MSDSHWDRLEALFEAACALPLGERDAFLKRECGDDLGLRDEVQSLLDADRSSNHLLDGSALDLAPPLAAPLTPGRQIGPYRVTAELGEGGMGAVYLAERCDGQFEQRVALKVVRFGLASPALVRRFGEERQILARLEHPGIARLLDGGVTDGGLPWFSMEYVEGEPIDRWCERRGLGVRARLELFAAVCDAVQYAQNNLVVHRDLKPSNILVTGDGAVKLLDFGIAKLVATNSEADDRALRTLTAAPLMTASYAAPEQLLGGRITTATDVYALGMVLYELLAGGRAYEVAGLTPTQLERAVCVDAPARPSSTVRDSRQRRHVAGDLDNICLKALAKEPERRYATAGQLGEDIRLHLSGLPVRARPATFGYLARKAIRRYRPQLTVAAAALVVLIVLGAWFTHRIAHERDLARREAARTTQVAKFLTSLFRVSDPEEARGKDISARELLQRGAARVGTELAGQPDLQATMDGVLGNVYLNLGLHDESDSLLTRAVALKQRLHVRDGPEYAEQLSNLGQLRVEQGRYADADSVLTAALAIQRRDRRLEDTRIASTMVSLGHIADLLGDYVRAEVLYREAIAVCKSSPKPDDLRLSTAMGALALELLDRDRLDESEKLFRETLELQRRTLGDDHPEVATTLFNLGLLLSNRGDFAGAEKIQRETMTLDRKLYGDEHPNVAYDLNNLAYLERQKGDFAQAESLARQALAMRRKLLGDDHPQTIETEANLAQLLQARGEYAAAAAAVPRSARREDPHLWQRQSVPVRRNQPARLVPVRPGTVRRGRLTASSFARARHRDAGRRSQVRCDQPPATRARPRRRAPAGCGR